ncbi:RipA family octameric membrane protein [Halorubrum halophilum]|uniref:RipA family octameric membrane protein n=1 Tax=Halorubrum halophilum TaxID=413816 RepID=UPI0012AC0099|nr:hypothetical protein [Halorubrum halophilum]
MDQPSRELALYLKSLDILQKQRELYWARVSAFLVLQGLLFTAASLARQDRRIIIFLGVFGVIFSVIWLIVMYYSDANIQNWEYVVCELEWDIADLDKHKLLELKIDAPEPDSRVPLPNFLKSKSFMIEQYIPVLTMLLWLSISTFYSLILIGYM